MATVFQMVFYERLGREIYSKKESKMNKYVLYIGMNDKDTHRQTITVLSAREVIMNTITSNGLDGATVSEAIGLYKHKDGTIITEQTLRVEVLFATDKQIKEILGKESRNICFFRETFTHHISSSSACNIWNTRNCFPII